MATLSTNTQIGTLSHGGILGGLIGRIARRIQQHRIYRQTYNELSALSARELDDLGIARCDIRRIALEAADLL